MSETETGGPDVDFGTKYEGEYAKGQGRVIRMGWINVADDNDDDASDIRFCAVVEFPSGPPNMSLGVVWNGLPVCIEVLPPPSSEGGNG